MKILALDDEKLALKRLTKSIMEAQPEAELKCFESAEEALFAVEQQEFDVAFLDIRGNDMDGISFARKLKEFYPRINIIFTTGYTEYAMDAFNMYASGYLLKPITNEKVKKALSELRYPIELNRKKRLRLQCFGTFESFYDGRPLPFRHTKTKEMLAYLYHNKGALVPVDTLLNLLWNDDLNHTNYLKQLRKDLNDTFRKLDIENLILKQKGSLGILYDKIESDYSEWLAAQGEDAAPYEGEYMTQYAWAAEGPKKN